ncbi:MAG: sigma-70 family RNA polymerase sigma factor [Candidatus Omnitrophota bacterium]
MADFSTNFSNIKSAESTAGKSEEDRRLIMLCQDGDCAAFERLYRRYAKDVFNMALRMVGSSEIAEEVVQETFISVFRDIRRFQFQSAFTTWLYRIALRRSADYFRKHKKRIDKTISIFQNSPDESPFEFQDGNPTPAERARENERRKVLEDAIDSLSFKQKKIVILRYIHHLSYEEIADILQCRLGTVKSRLNRAHKSLEQALKIWDIF